MRAFSVRVLRRLFPRYAAAERYLRQRYPQYEIGTGTYGDPEILSWNEGSTLRIGAYTSIAAGVTIFLGGEHRVDWVTTYPFSALWASADKYEGHPATKGDVTIGNDVWIGNGATILSGVRIGDGAVIGAGAVVSKDVAPYAIAVGNPARIIRARFSEPVIVRLLELQWWRWSEAKIGRSLPELLSNDIERFLLRAERGDYDDPGT